MSLPAQQLVQQIVSDGRQAGLDNNELSENILYALLEQGHVSEMNQLGRVLGPLMGKDKSLGFLGGLIRNERLFERLSYEIKGEPELPETVIEDLNEVIRIILLRQLQDHFKEIVSWDRVKDNPTVFGADDYSLDAVLRDVEIYALSKGYSITASPQTVKKLIKTIISEYPFNKNSMAQLENYAVENGYMKNYIESPDLLLDVYKRDPHLSGGVVRFAPTPNGPLSIGHGRGVSILSEYCDMYGMDLILRFDDTDQDPVKGSDLPPEFGIPDVYEWIEEDLKWIKGDSNFTIVRASDRKNLDYYEKVVRNLIREGLAFVVYQSGTQKDTNAFVFNTNKDINLRLLDYMKEGKLDLTGEFKKMRAINEDNEYIDLIGDELKFDDAYVLLAMDSIKPMDIMDMYLMSQYDVNIVKRNMKEALTSLQVAKFSTLKALRGTTKIMRLQTNQNIRVKNRGEVQYIWPTLRLQAPVDDYRYDVTHNIRGPDYALKDTAIKFEKKQSGKVKLSDEDRQNIMNAGMQGLIYKLIGGKAMNDIVTWGLVDADGVSISTSKFKRKIMSGELPPYDSQNPDGGFRNPSIPTIYSIRSRPGMEKWGRIFRTYWTRFKMPLNLNPNFSNKEFDSYSKEIFREYPSPKGLIEDDRIIRNAIFDLINKEKYLSEEY